MQKSKRRLAYDVYLNGIKKQGYKMITPMVVCNADEFAEFKTVADGDVNVGDDVIRIVR